MLLNGNRIETEVDFCKRNTYGDEIVRFKWDDKKCALFLSFDSEHIKNLLLVFNRQNKNVLKVQS